MSRDEHLRALRHVAPAPGVLAQTSAERRLAAEHWLLSTRPEHHAQVRTEWREHGVALLPLGTLFSAVRIPGEVIQAVAFSTELGTIDAFLKDALTEGPVICDPYANRYYALVAGSSSSAWRPMARDRLTRQIDCLGRGAYLGVPRPDAVEFTGRETPSYWSVPMPSAAVLCDLLDVVQLISTGISRLTQKGEGDGDMARLSTADIPVTPRHRPAP